MFEVLQNAFIQAIVLEIDNEISIEIVKGKKN